MTVMAVGQVDPVVGDIDGNLDLAVTAVREAAGRGATVVALPVGCLTGLPVGDLAERSAFTAAVAAASQRLAGVAAELGVAVALADGQPEAGLVGAAAEVRVFGSLAAAEAAPAGGELVVLDAVPAHVGSLGDLRRRVLALAGRCEKLAFANLAGATDDVVFAGGSLVAAGAVSQGRYLESDLVLEGERRPGPVLAEAGVAEIAYRVICAGLAAYGRKNGITKAVLGLSGGIDSALVAVMAADVFGGSNVIGVSMPSAYSSQHSRNDAALTARVNGIDYRVIPIEELVSAFQAANPLTGVASENLQARVRGVLLMGISNQEGGLVLATGNRTEVAVGYSTIYGDTVGGYAPLGDADKTLVWQMARWRNELADAQGATPPIPESSITKPPSAELAPGQQDSDSLPPYARLDPLVQDALVGQYTRSELVARGHQAADVDRLFTLASRAEWKRRQYAPAPQLHPRGFRRGRQVPITSRWREQV
ncbi:NAD(+) synthase [Buchananella hordeovulneris]|uniref:NAD(+) synthase n=1 Tax=Buchananella hordeovulneris TaxID=52770 RepID=UPI0026DBC6EE|nr:NAD(+) synthase [Buchananella hordeovulneris]MDO5081050.1 NAD(+) synthase [Buchananella hordeovulneris]